MKRPNGITPPARPATPPPAPPAAPKQPAQKRPAQKRPAQKQPAQKQPASKPPATQKATEPPTTPKPPTNARPSNRVGGNSSKIAGLGELLPTRSGVDAGTVTGGAGAGRGTGSDARTGSGADTRADTATGVGVAAAGGSRWRSGESLARKNLRVAERRRRRFERLEARRFTERSRRRRLTWLVSLGSIALLVLVVLFTAYSPVFAVRAISVEGTSRIDASQVQSALQDQVGKPLALVDFGRMQSELGQFALIQSYSTESSLPNTLIVRIVERQPVGAVAATAGFDLVDPAGVTVSHSDARPDGFPVIDLAGTAIGSPGFLGAAAVLRSMPPELLAKVDTISAATPDSVTFTLLGAGQKVVWGSSANSALKARVLDKLIGTQDAYASLTYDVSSPESPVVS